MERAGSLESKIRVRHGLERERQIANALKVQIGLPIRAASDFEDKERKVDRWIDYPDGPVALQIKYREVGEDLLFEVYDKWFDWDDRRNKLGRDMFGDAKEYAVLLADKHTVVMVPTQLAKNTIQQLLSLAKENGFVEGMYSSTLRHFVNGSKLELKVQHDPADHRQKMVAYIPASYFVNQAQAKIYEVKLPKKWKFDEV
jgi:hypothetical protein